MLRNFEVSHGLRERHKHRMPRLPRVAGRQFDLPLIEQVQRRRRIADLIPEII